jgi:predicted enzyme related to lactoylglutathione lyase
MGKDGWRWIEVRFPGAVTTLHFHPRENDTRSAGPVLVLVDDDVEGTVESLRAKGTEIVAEPHEAPWQPGRTVAEFVDSEGNRMVLGSPCPAAHPSRQPPWT